jgi:hypothetical protein
MRTISILRNPRRLRRGGCFGGRALAESHAVNDARSLTSNGNSTIATSGTRLLLALHLLRRAVGRSRLRVALTMAK